MQTATVSLALGGDTGNTIQKYDTTPAEVAVLRVIHGDDAVFDIEPGKDVDRTNRAELERLRTAYGLRQPDGSSRAPAVDQLFPGAAARVFETFKELELPEEQFKPTKRAQSDPLDHDNDGKKGGSLPAEPTDDVDVMTVIQLREYADKENIDLTGLTRKDDILAAVKAGKKKEDVPAEEPVEDDGIGEMNDDNLFE